MNLSFETVTHHLAFALLHSLWQVAMVAGILALALTFARRAPAAVRCLLSTLALGICVALFAFNLTSAGADLRQPSHAPALLTTPVGENVSQPPGEESLPARSLPTAAPAPPQAPTPSFRLPQWLVGGYLAGVALLAARHLGGCWQLRALRRSGVPLARTYPTIACNLITLPAVLGWPRALPPVLISARARLPMLIGLVRPIIVLPLSAVTGLPIDQLKNIVAHELAHLRRLDPWINHAQAIAETLLFFHPAAWWISRQIRREREHACDDLVVRALEQPTVYAHALVSLEELTAQPATALAANGARSRSEFAHRIDRILGLATPTDHALPAVFAGLAAVIVLLSFVATSTAAPDRPPGVRGAIFDRNGVILATSDDSPKRTYPLGELGFHAIGTVNVRDDETTRGTTGIEKQCDAILNAGGDVHLTLDTRILALTESALAKIERGTAIVIDPATGNILSLISKPALDPNVFAGALDPVTWRRMSRDPDKPFLNRAISPNPPSFAFAYVVAMASYQNGTTPPPFTCDGNFPLGGRIFRCWNREGHGEVGILEALQTNCNIYFYQLGIDIGPEKMFATARALGFGTTSGILPDESRGWDFDWQELVASRRTKWGAGDSANSAIGVGFTSATPLQIARMTCAIANGGTPVNPLLILSTVENKTGETTTTRPQNPLRIPVSENDLALIRQSMFERVNAEGGATGLARSSTVDIAGTSGSATSSHGSVAWFTGFAPFDNPQLVVTVLVEGAESGNRNAAPIGKEVLESSLAP